MDHGDLKGLSRRTASDKVLHDTAFNTNKNPKHDEYPKGSLTMVYKTLNKRLQVVRLKVKYVKSRLG